MARKIPLKYSSVDTKQSKKTSSYFQKSGRHFSWFTTLLRYVGWFFVVGIVGLVSGYVYLSTQLPDLKKMEDVILPEATVITDRNGEVLYKIFQENRSYVEYDAISPHMINAIVAIEDQSFWTNSGIDMRGIARAIRNTIFEGSREGGSTITQQLLKNIILTDESSKYIRKLKEWMLAGKLNNLIKSQVKEKNPGLAGDELQRKMKEEILELYLNYIFLGQNSYGVQAASQTYFGKNASEISPLEAAILASLPKSPTKYNPYINPIPVMGKLRFYQGAEEVQPSAQVLKEVRDHIGTLLPRLQLENKDVDAIVKQLTGLMDFTLTVDAVTYRVGYDLGRKDYVLINMVDEKTLEPTLFKSAFLEGFTYAFSGGGRVDIKAPHFVRWIQDIVLDMFPEEGEQLLQRGGLRIKTTLDYTMQEWAETAVEENYRNILDKGGNNASMIYLDSVNGDILTYVGSADYFNTDIDGEFDIVRALRQPGSSIKPFIYALGIEKLGLTADTPIFDLPLSVGGNTPNNSDGRFEGLMPLRKALAYSRNIAPIKIFMTLGGEDIVKPFLRNIGLKSLSAKVGYGYPLAIGAGEVQMLELANAYAHLSASGRPAVIDPILEITSSDGSILYKKKVTYQEQYIPEGVAHLLSRMLSTKANMPPGWVSNYTLNGGVTYATKSGTSDVKIIEGGREVIRPRDGWLAAYTPSKVAIFWAGNTDAKPMGPKAFGGWLTAPIWKTFWGQLIRENLLVNETFSRDGMVSLMVDKYTGLLPSSSRPAESSVSTWGYQGNVPFATAPTRESLQYDSSCNGKVSPLTPAYEVGEGWLVKPLSFMADNRDLSAIKKWYSDQSGFFLEMPESVCEGRDGQEDESIVISIMKPVADGTVTRTFDVWYSIQDTRQLKTIRVYLNDVQVGEKFLRNKTSVNDIMTVSAYQGLEPGQHLLMVEVADVDNYVNRRQLPIFITDVDDQLPYLMDDKIVIDGEEGGYTVYMAFADDASGIQSVVLESDGETIIPSLIEGSIARFTLATLGSISYTVTDTSDNVGEGTIDLSQYQ